MKKFISLLILVTVLAFCLSFSVSAEFQELTISEDFQSLTLDGLTFYRVDSTYVILNDFFWLDQEPQLTPQQQELLRGCRISMAPLYNYLEAEYFFKDGSVLSCSYATEDFAPKLEAYQLDETTKCCLEFRMNNAYVQEVQLKGQPTTLDSVDLDYVDVYSVTAVVSDQSFYIETGSLIVSGDHYYYADYSELAPLDPHNFYVYNCDNLECYEVTDEDALTQIKKAIDNYETYSEGTVTVWGIISAAFYIVVFAVVPAGIMVMALIFCIRGKGYYRYTWGITAAFALLELIAFVSFVVALSLTA